MWECGIRAKRVASPARSTSQTDTCVSSRRLATRVAVSGSLDEECVLGKGSLSPVSGVVPFGPVGEWSLEHGTHSCRLDTCVSRLSLACTFLRSLNDEETGAGYLVGTAGAEVSQVSHPVRGESWEAALILEYTFHLQPKPDAVTSHNKTK